MPTLQGWIKVRGQARWPALHTAQRIKLFGIHKQLIIRSRIIEASPFLEFYIPATICAVAFSSSAMVVPTHNLRKTITVYPLNVQKSLLWRITKLVCAYMKYPVMLYQTRFSVQRNHIHFNIQTQPFCKKGITSILAPCRLHSTARRKRQNHFEWGDGDGVSLIV